MASRLKKKKLYSEESLKQALSDIRDGKTGIREACRQYGVPRATVQDRISGRVAEDEIKQPGPDPVLGEMGERKIVDWIITIAKCGFPIKKQELLDTVEKIVKDSNQPNPFKNNRPGQKWYSNFLKRHPEVSHRSAETINKARAQITEESIRGWFMDLKTYLTDINKLDILENPGRIFNGDESGFALCPKTGKVLGPRGYRNLYEVKPGSEKDNLTVLVTFNAAGNVCPPLVVFPYVRPPKAIVESMPPDWCLGKSESGWMKSEVFFEYITNDFNNWLERNEISKPILLLVDGHKSHMSLVLSVFCEEIGIILYALPPNTTHILQPADVSVFKPLKEQWKKTVRKFLSKIENVNKSVTKTNFCSLFRESLDESDMKSYIISGFKKCGLYPFNPDAIDFTKCVQNTLLVAQTERTQRNTSQKNATAHINNADLVSTRKVLNHLKPVLKKKNIDVRIVLKEVKKLRKPAQRHKQEAVNNSSVEVLYQTETDDATGSTLQLDLSNSVQSRHTSLPMENSSMNTHTTTYEDNAINAGVSIIRTESDPRAQIIEPLVHNENVYMPEKEIIIQNLDAIPTGNEISVEDQGNNMYAELQAVPNVPWESCTRTADEGLQTTEDVLVFTSAIPNTESSDGAIFIETVAEINPTRYIRMDEDQTERNLTDIPIHTQEQDATSYLQAAKTCLKATDEFSVNHLQGSYSQFLASSTPQHQNSDTNYISLSMETLVDSIPTLITDEDFPQNKQPVVQQPFHTPTYIQQKEAAKDQQNTIYHNHNKIVQTHSQTTVSTSRAEQSDPTLSTLHLSGSYLEVGSVVSLDDIVVIPPQINVSAFARDPFETHLYMPETKTDKPKPVKPRTPAAISSFAWRKFYKDKENLKKIKAEEVMKRRQQRKTDLEEKKKKTEMKTRKVPKQRIIPKKKRALKINQNTNKNSKIKCSKCTEELVSDVEEDAEKNIGCDHCPRWFHLKCTSFNSLVYSEVANKPYKCTEC